jgi:hypothetical protein
MLKLRSEITCPHCWSASRPDELLRVSQHADLLGDPVLGAEAPARFLPTRFTVEGDALDAGGMSCHALACPRCHLVLPEGLLSVPPLFCSIIGAPASGKSYFLTAMTWRLRHLLPSAFSVAFTDADAVCNRALHEYEQTLFLQEDPAAWVALRKTELQGDLYDQIQLGRNVVNLPHPFLFFVRPSGGAAADAGRVLCLYDNAGEHFQPGADSVTSPVTRHLAHSAALLFLFDPLQDPRFRARCRRAAGETHDPQLDAPAMNARQDAILVEAAVRVRRYARLAPGDKHAGILAVVVTKYDAWEPLLPLDLQREPVAEAGVDAARVGGVSAKLRALLLEIAPELVGAAEDFAREVVYVPISSLGRSPEPDPSTGMLGVRPESLQPRWVAAPMLYALSRLVPALVPTAG